MTENLADAGFANQCRPLSVQTTDDATILTWAIPFYLRRSCSLFPPVIVDATWGRGRFWKGSPWAHLVTGHDLKTDGVDFRHLPERAGSVDVLVFDPPHVSEQSERGQVRSRQGFETHGTQDVCDIFPDFLQEARRVVDNGGILLAKIADQVHRSCSRWQHVRFITEAERFGWTVCDLLVKTRRNVIMDPRWLKILHARKSHCFWIVCRKEKC